VRGPRLGVSDDAVNRAVDVVDEAVDATLGIAHRHGRVGHIGKLYARISAGTGGAAGRVRAGCARAFGTGAAGFVTRARGVGGTDQRGERGIETRAAWRHRSRGRLIRAIESGEEAARSAAEAAVEADNPCNDDWNREEGSRGGPSPNDPAAPLRK
jgi:hypothetical protein